MEETIERQQGALNPWLSMWIRPRGTVRQLVDSSPRKHVTMLAAISGIYQLLDTAAERAWGDDMPLILILFLALFLGALGGVLGLHISGALFHWSGRLFGGTANSTFVRTAVAWSSLPDLALLGIYAAVMAVFGRDWFASSPAWTDAEFSFAITASRLFAIVGLVLVVWRAFLLTKSLAEVHGFSAWRGLASILVGTAVVGVPVLVMLFGCRALV